MPAFDQQALVDLFRQSFSPITQLGAAQVQMQQAALERDYLQQAQAAQRQQALKDHIAGLYAQNQFETQRQSAIEGLRAEAELRRSVAAAGAAAQGNRALAADARTAQEMNQARTLAANMGIEVDPADPDFVNKVTKEAARQMKTHRGSATELQRELNGITDQIGKLSTDLDLPEARQVAIAKPILLSLADPKQAAALKKLTSVDDVLAAAADVPGATEKIVGLLQKEQQIRNATFQKRALPLQTRQGQIQRTLQVLEGKGISPDYEALKPAISNEDDTGTAGDMAAAAGIDLSAVPPPPAKGQAAAETAGSTNWLGPTLAAAGGATAVARMAKAPLAAAGGATGRALRFVGSRVFRPTNLNPSLAAASMVEGINSAPTIWGGEPMTASLAGLLVGDYGSELENQRAKLARINSLLPRVDPATAVKLRAMKYAPTLPDNSDLMALLNMGGVPMGMQQ